MKYIVAGYGKTGTKSIATALKQLGLVVYDLEEHLCIHHNEWWRILRAEDEEACSPEIFKKMYENVDVAIDTPVYSVFKNLCRSPQFGDFWPKILLKKSKNDQDQSPDTRICERTVNFLGANFTSFP